MRGLQHLIACAAFQGDSNVNEEEMKEMEEIEETARALRKVFSGLQKILSKKNYC